MSVRIRKLARELDRNPAEILGVLHALGFQRYRTADDMLTPVVEAKLRRGLARGVAPVDVDLSEPERAPDSVEAIADTESDVMAQLVPGAVRAGLRGTKPSTPSAIPRSPPPRPSLVPEPRPAPTPPQPSVVAIDREELDGLRRSFELERAALDSTRRTLESERAVLEAQRADVDTDRRRVATRERALDGDRVALDELRAALEREREQLSAERAALQAVVRTRREGTPLVDLLEARGLRGSDEHERALVALARGRHLRDVLWAVSVDPPDALVRILDERLVLAAGDVPESVVRGAASVAVAQERSDLPDTATLDRWLAQVSERMLLHGHRRLLVAGGRARWHRLLRERLDSRIEARYLPGGLRTRAMATEDVAWADVVVLWATPIEDAAKALYMSARPVTIEVEGEHLSGFFEAILSALPS